jgi:hypothetical protein
LRPHLGHENHRDLAALCLALACDVSSVAPPNLSLPTTPLSNFYDVSLAAAPFPYDHNLAIRYDVNSAANRSAAKVSGAMPFADLFLLVGHRAK